MKFDKNIAYNLGCLFAMLLALSFVSKKIKTREDKLNANFDESSVNQFLAERNELLKSNKPPLWIHIPYEHNTRNQKNFGAPLSQDLNQPYLNETVKSIIKNCGDTFAICIIDDYSFEKLVPNWKINMSHMFGPSKDYIRLLGLMRLLYIYGGMICPVSFLCQKDLIDFYEESAKLNSWVLFQKKNKSLSQEQHYYLPNLEFSASPSNNETVLQTCNFLEQLISSDPSSESHIIDRIGLWINNNLDVKNNIKVYSGSFIGTQTSTFKDILLEDLFETKFVDFAKNKVGVLIPYRDILKRKNYNWFCDETLENIVMSDTVIGKQFALSIGSKSNHNLNHNSKSNFNFKLTPSEQKLIEKQHVGYWETPSNTIFWGLKPNYLGDNIQVKHKY